MDVIMYLFNELMKFLKQTDEDYVLYDTEDEFYLGD